MRTNPRASSSFNAAFGSAAAPLPLAPPSPLASSAANAVSAASKKPAVSLENLEYSSASTRNTMASKSHGTAAIENSHLLKEGMGVTSTDPLLAPPTAFPRLPPRFLSLTPAPPPIAAALLCPRFFSIATPPCPCPCPCPCPRVLEIPASGTGARGGIVDAADFARGRDGKASWSCECGWWRARLRCFRRSRRRSRVARIRSSSSDSSSSLGLRSGSTGEGGGEEGKAQGWMGSMVHCASCSFVCGSRRLSSWQDKNPDNQITPDNVIRGQAIKRQQEHNAATFGVGVVRHALLCSTLGAVEPHHSVSERLRTRQARY